MSPHLHPPELAYQDLVAVQVVSRAPLHRLESPVSNTQVTSPLAEVALSKTPVTSNDPASDEMCNSLPVMSPTSGAAHALDVGHVVLALQDVPPKQTESEKS